jgi:hypothetical protein
MTLLAMFVLVVAERRRQGGVNEEQASPAPRRKELQATAV